MLHARDIWLGIVILGVLFFLDAPFLTFGQKFTSHRPRARWILVSFEVDLVILWGVAKYFLHADRNLLPAAAEEFLTVAGLVVTLLGVALSVWAKLRLGRWFSATFGVKPGHQLVTDGPYGVTRHPIYTGLLTALLGSALVWNSVLTLGLAVLFAVPLFLHTVYEESLFEAYFGDDYHEYQRRVPRLAPLPRP